MEIKYTKITHYNNDKKVEQVSYIETEKNIKDFCCTEIFNAGKNGIIGFDKIQEVENDPTSTIPVITIRAINANNVPVSVAIKFCPFCAQKFILKQIGSKEYGELENTSSSDIIEEKPCTN